MKINTNDQNDNHVMNLFLDWVEQVAEEPVLTLDSAVPASEFDFETNHPKVEIVAEKLYAEGRISIEKRDEIKSKFAGCVLTNIELMPNIK